MPEPKKRNWNIVKAAIGAVLVIGISSAIYRNYNDPDYGPEKGIVTESVTPQSTLGLHRILISEDWSPEVDLGFSKGKKISWTTPRADVGFFLYINGGEEMGGIEDYVPCRNDWVRLKYKPKFYTNEIITVRFALDGENYGYTKAQLVYLIERAD